MAKNMFGSFDAAVDQREREQERIEAVVKGERPKAGRPKKRGEGATTMTICISREDKERIKDYAYRHNTGVSDLLHQWIEEHCGKGE